MSEKMKTVLKSIGKVAMMATIAVIAIAAIGIATVYAGGGRLQVVERASYGNHSELAVQIKWWGCTQVNYGVVNGRQLSGHVCSDPEIETLWSTGSYVGSIFNWEDPFLKFWNQDLGMEGSQTIEIDFCETGSAKLCASLSGRANDLAIERCDFRGKNCYTPQAVK